ncbi:protein IDA-LIKE 2-like [Panicum virgatum]|uniref:Uncharacterized protein n=1 Tax=Panicum virgatum TaxID=38727 RepID=A0A8T0QFV9_PANVG|nr:protein IDA-LIKE 2-like [Panicum virgatum]KAG2572068.1 hypothetical protein PVAP13_7KG147000 [Panicum virgatum]
MGRCWQRSGRRWLLPPQLLRWSSLLLLLVALLPSCCQASRGRVQPFEGRPLEGAAPSSFFLGFLPRRPVPPSGPSRQHNSVGLESQRQQEP